MPARFRCRVRSVQQQERLSSYCFSDRRSECRTRNLNSYKLRAKPLETVSRQRECEKIFQVKLSARRKTEELNLVGCHVVGRHRDPLRLGSTGDAPHWAAQELPQFSAFYICRHRNRARLSRIAHDPNPCPCFYIKLDTLLPSSPK